MGNEVNASFTNYYFTENKVIPPYPCSLSHLFEKLMIKQFVVTEITSGYVRPAIRPPNKNFG